MAETRAIPHVPFPAAGLLVAAMAAILYAAFAFGFFLPAGVALVGDKVYDYYMLSLFEGRFDIPPRIATLEGHYDAEGRAYVYHGIAPLITRLIAAPFVDLRSVTGLGSFTVWIFAAMGSAALHLALARIVTAFGPAGAHGTLWHVTAGAMAWLCAPGLLFAANHALFHEPNAVAYFCACGSVALYSAVLAHGIAPLRAAIPLALLAGLALFARPHVSVGLYAGVLALLLEHVRRSGRLTPSPRALAALAILGIFGAAQLGLNQIRFGDPFTMHGAPGEGGVQYGYNYWGKKPNSARQGDGAENAFAVSGAFSLARVPAHSIVYFVDIPWTMLPGRSADDGEGPVDALFRAATLDRFGYVEIEGARVGGAFLWTPWLAAAVLGALAMRPATRPAGGPAPPGHAFARGWFALLGTGVIALLILSYGWITLRYKFEVFPMVAMLGLIAAPALLTMSRRAAAKGKPDWWLGLTMAAMVPAVLLSLGLAVFYADDFRQIDVISRWSFETCETLVLEKGFAPDRVPHLCRL